MTSSNGLVAPTGARLGILLLGLVLAAGPAEALNFVVNSTLDTADAGLNGVCDVGGGVCTLRAAIQESNFGGAGNTITFTLGAGPYSIAVGAAGLPAITRQVAIDGYSQAGSAVNTLPVGSNAVLLIELNGAATGAGVNGLTLNAAGITVRGLVINRFAGYGIRVNAAGTGATIRGNFVGTNAAGTAGLGNNRDGVGSEAGIGLFASGATLGGTAPADRNLVSGNSINCARGIELYEASNNTIQGNYVGTNAAGTAAIPNACGGVVLDGTPGVGSDNNTVGGAAAGAGNLLSGNQAEGIFIQIGSDSNTIQGNIVGLNAAGTVAIPNGAQGIKIFATGNVVGGDTPAEANVIAGNTAEGIRVEGVSATANALVGNRIYGNGGLGINLNADGVTPNDALDADTGPNDLLNFPVITGVAPVGASLGVTLSLDVPAGSYRIEFFRNPSGVDPSGNGEGEVFAGFQNVTHGGGGPLFFTASVSGACSDRITATASFCSDGTACATLSRTSEFSAVAPACSLYRSVGITATPLASGAANGLTISGSAATFGSGLPSNVGVGDVIQYDSDGNSSIDALAFIHGRTSAQTYTVANRLGAAPTPVVGDNDWAIYRAYTSLANWEGRIENANISEPTEDDVNPALNLVTANTVLSVACYADGVDTTTPVIIAGWTTDATRYIRIFTPTHPSEVGTSQRHRGVFGTGYRLNVTNDDAIRSDAAYLRIEGLTIQATVTNNFGGPGGILSGPVGASDVRISHNIVKGIISAGVTGVPVGIGVGDLGDALNVHRVWNNIVYDFTNNFAQPSHGLSLEGGTVYAFNNTVFNSKVGIVELSPVVGGELRNNVSINYALNALNTDYLFPADMVWSHNVSSDATSETAALRNKTAYATYFKNTTPGSEDFHLNGTSLSLWTSNGMNLSAHPSLPVTNDIDRGPRVRPDIGADEFTAIELYRSVGTTATSLASGAANALTISGSTATFGSALPDNIGVGDVIQYDSDGNASIDALAFIHGRTNAQTFTVKNKSGGTPTAVAGDNNWNVFRAYTRLANWESQTENANILEPVENDVNPPLDLATAGAVMNVACYGDGDDVGSVYIDGWTTGPATYIRIYTPVSPTEVGTSQRHNGAWDTSAYRLSQDASYFAVIGVFERYVRIDGLQLNTNQIVSTESNGIQVDDGNGDLPVEFQISNNIIRSTTAGLPSVAYGIGALNGFDTPDNSLYVAKVWNNVVYGYLGSSTTGIYADVYGTLYAYNNTVIGAGGAAQRGFVRYGNTVVHAKNNISINTLDPYQGVFSASSTNNFSDLGDAPGLNPKTRDGAGADPVFVGGVDYHLAPGDTWAQDQGTNLSADPFLAVYDDIDGQVRQAPSDIGADDANGTTTAVELLSFEAVAADAAVDLSWGTGSELDNLGFHLYRADSTDGPSTRITSSPIPGLGSSPTGQSYSYRDPGLVNGRTYYYWLEDVETTGRTEKHGPVSATPVTTSGGPDIPPGPTRSGGTSYGDPAAVTLREVERSPGHVVLELLTGGFMASTAEEGRVSLRIPGFESVSRPGEPSLPMRRALVEVASGRKVRLASVLASDELRFPGLRPVPQGLPGIEVNEDGTVLASEEKSREGRGFEGLFPAESALLLGTSFQGETKKAEVLLFPLGWDGSGLTLSRRLLVRLEFSGTQRQETSRGGSQGRRWVNRESHSRRGVVAQMVVTERGLQRVAYEDVFGSGLGGQGRGLHDSSLRLSRQGESVAFHVEPLGGPFGPGSSLYFLSEGPDLNLYGDAVYELETNTTHRGLRMEVEGVVASTSRAVSEYFPEVRLEENHYYQPGLLEAPDPWLWDVVVSPGNKSFGFTVSDLLPSSSSTGRLRVEMQGASDFEGVLDHHVRVKVNGRFVGETAWDGKVPATLDLALEPGVLQDGTNTLELEDVGDAGASYSMVFLNRFRVSYPRRLVASQGTLEGRFESSGPAEIEGASPSSMVLDTTDVPRWLVGATATANGLSLSVEAGRSYLLTSTVRRPEVRRLLPSGLKDTTNQADYLLLGPQAFLPAAQPLLDLRESQGLLTKAVSLEEVYEQFGHGEAGPAAIKEFLEYAYHFWATPSPRYVLLLGDASYDPKDYLGTGTKDRLPGFPLKTSYLWTVSDPAYASVNGEDLLPDVAIGRLPAGTLDEAMRLVQKVTSYENGGGRLDGSAVLVADNADLAGNFEADADDIAGTVLASRNPRKIYYSRLLGGTRAAIIDAFDQGASLMSYVGHGGTAVWASENIFNSQQVQTLAPQLQQPLLMTMNCLNGFFHFPPLNSLAEALLKAEGRGAVGAFSPSGMSVNDSAHLFHKALLEEIVSGRHERIGDAILVAQERYAQTGSFPELLSIYHLLGDPALRIR